MANEEGVDGTSVDDASGGFHSLNRILARRKTTTTSSKEDVNAIRALCGAWFRTYRPIFAEGLGDLPALSQIDASVKVLFGRTGSRLTISTLRADLRAIGRSIDRHLVPAYHAARWSAAVVADAPLISAGSDELLAIRLDQLNPELGVSYRQVRADLSDALRGSFVGTAGEIREVMRAVIHVLGPDDEVKSQSWYAGHEGKPTQAERIRYVLEQRLESGGSATDAAAVVDTKVGVLGRALYTRASGAFHAGTQRDEVGRIIGYVDAILNELLP